MSSSSWISRLGAAVARLVLAAFASALGVLLCGIVVLVLRMPPEEAHLLASLALKLFMLLLVGSVGVACFVFAGSLLWPGSPQPTEPAAALQGVCPGCGHTRGESDCGGCGLPLTEARWQRPAEHASIWLGLFLSSIMGGIGALGLFMGVEAVTERDLGWGTRVAYSALALLMMSVGGGGVAGAWLDFKESRRRKPVDFECRTRWQDHDGYREVSASASGLEGSELQGSSFYPAHLSDLQGSLSATPAERALAVVLERLILADHVGVSGGRTIRWRRSLREAEQAPSVTGYRQPTEGEAVHREEHSDLQLVRTDGLEAHHSVVSMEVEATLGEVLDGQPRLDALRARLREDERLRESVVRLAALIEKAA